MVTGLRSQRGPVQREGEDTMSTEQITKTAILPGGGSGTAPGGASPSVRPGGNGGSADLCPAGAAPEAYGGPWFDQIAGGVRDAEAEARLMLQQAAAMERICRCGNELDPKMMGCLERATTGDQIGAFCANCVEGTLAKINFMLGAVPGLAQHHLRITRWNSIVVYSAAGD